MSKPLDPASFAKNGSEHGHQVAYFCWCSQNLHIYPELRLAYAIPNGGQRNKITAAHLKAEGVKAGMLDICIPVAKCRYHGIYIELKVGKNKPTDEQYLIIAELRKQGYAAEWVIGWEALRDLTLLYLQGAYKHVG